MQPKAKLLRFGSSTSSCRKWVLRFKDEHNIGDNYIVETLLQDLPVKAQIFISGYAMNRRPKQSMKPEFYFDCILFLNDKKRLSEQKFNILQQSFDILGIPTPTPLSISDDDLCLKYDLSPIKNVTFPLTKEFRTAKLQNMLKPNKFFSQSDLSSYSSSSLPEKTNSQQQQRQQPQQQNLSVSLRNFSFVTELNAAGELEGEEEFKQQEELKLQLLPQITIPPCSTRASTQQQSPLPRNHYYFSPPISKPVVVTHSNYGSPLTPRTSFSSIPSNSSNNTVESSGLAYCINWLFPNHQNQLNLIPPSPPSNLSQSDLVLHQRFIKYINEHRGNLETIISSLPLDLTNVYYSNIIFAWNTYIGEVRQKDIMVIINEIVCKIVLEKITFKQLHDLWFTSYDLAEFNYRLSIIIPILPKLQLLAQKVGYKFATQ